MSQATGKLYACKECGHKEIQVTNHYGETYSCGRYNCCPKCPPYKKYPEYGGATIWVCQEKPPEELYRGQDD